VYKTSKMMLDIVMEYADGGDLRDLVKSSKEVGRKLPED